MKKLIVILFTLFIGILVSAQTQTKPTESKPLYPTHNENRKVLFGVSFGPTFDWFAASTEGVVRKSAKAGFRAGIPVDINLTKEKNIYFSTGVFVRYLQSELTFDHRYDFHLLDTSLVLGTNRTFQSTYLVIPTALKLRTSPSKNCVFTGNVGLYHAFAVGGHQFDNFKFPDDNVLDPTYSITTDKKSNKDAALFSESAFFGLGFEYLLNHGTRVFAFVDYTCQFNYFSKKAITNVTNQRFKGVVHSLEIKVGFAF